MVPMYTFLLAGSVDADFVFIKGNYCYILLNVTISFSSDRKHIFSTL